MTEREKMEAGLIYDPMDAELMSEQTALLEGLHAFNLLPPSAVAEKQRYMRTVFAECGESCYIELPFHANWGGAHVHFGDRVYANFNLTLVDDGHIYVGSRVKFGPNVTVVTAAHPIAPELRERGLQYNRGVHIGNNVWIGAGAVILPGVSIGENSVIGAGSVVTRDVQANAVAAGVPCRVMRSIGERDSGYYYRNERIDPSLL